MKRLLYPLLAAAILLGAPLSAIPQAVAPAPGQTTADKDALTIEQAMNVLTALETLSEYPVTDKDGRTSLVRYRFSGNTRILIAINMDLARTLRRQFETAKNGLIREMADGGTKVPDDKVPAYQVELVKMLEAQSRIGFLHIKLADLCLDEAPPACPVAQPIPGPILGLLLPIIDR